MRRWVCQTPWGSVRLHRWRRGDDARALHDHAWWYWTLVLWGGYQDVGADGQVDELVVGSLRFREALRLHTVRNPRPGTWTLLVTGPTSRRWRFWVDGRFLRRDKYFAQYGHHPCGDEDQPVRMRPDGTRIKESE